LNVSRSIGLWEPLANSAQISALVADSWRAAGGQRLERGLCQLMGAAVSQTHIAHGPVNGDLFSPKRTTANAPGHHSRRVGTFAQWREIAKVPIADQQSVRSLPIGANPGEIGKTRQRIGGELIPG
jgi:hypothetical protein